MYLLLDRERAAYVVSEKLGGICGVPFTSIARLKHDDLEGGQQLGSLQLFVDKACDMTDMGPTGIDDDEVHKVRRSFYGMCMMCASTCIGMYTSGWG
jgi:hypothetical protein